MDYLVKNDIPPFFLKEDDTKKFMEIFQYGLEVMHDDITGILDTITYVKCEEKYLDLMLIEADWTLDIPLTVNLKRKIIKIAQEMYLKKGLKQGIIDAIGQLVGLSVTVTITELLEQSFRVNKTGFNLSYIGLNNTDKKASHFIGGTASAMTFHVNTPTLTSDQENMIIKIVDFMKWAPTIYEIKQIL
jgi:phage tail-like protein